MHPDIAPQPAEEITWVPDERRTSPLSVQIGGDHYKNMAIQPIEFIIANKLTFLEGCVVKRICRHRSKNGREDLLKAIHEIELMIDSEYGPQA